MNIMTRKCIPTLRVAFMYEFRIFKTLVEKTNKHQIGPQDTIGKVLKCRCLKCFCIIHLNLKFCMNYDEKRVGNQIENLIFNHKST
jgi:hypothetical protein